MMLFMQNPPPITVSGQNSTSVYQLTLQSANLKEIYEWAPQLMAKMRELPGFVDVNTRPADREPAGDGGYRPRPRAVAGRDARSRCRTRCSAAYGSREVSVIYAPANQYSVILEVQPQYQRSAGGAVQAVRALVATARWCRSNAWCAARSVGRAAQHQPFRPVAGGDGVVQPEAGLFAGRGGAAGGRRDPRTAACRPPSAPTSRAR